MEEWRGFDPTLPQGMTNKSKIKLPATSKNGGTTKWTIAKKIVTREPALKGPSHHAPDLIRAIARTFEQEGTARTTEQNKKEERDLDRSSTWRVRGKIEQWARGC